MKLSGLRAADDYFHARADDRAAFLAAKGWTGVAISPLKEDWAFRRYYRVTAAGKTAVLLDSVPDHEPQATQGHKLADLVRLSEYLGANKFKVPKVFASDLNAGYLLLEDFGDARFSDLLERGGVPEPLYKLAVDVLAGFRDLIQKNEIMLPNYRDTHIHTARRRVIDWYVPALHGRKNAAGLTENYLAVWAEIEKKLPPCPEGFVHGDFHPGNLMLVGGQCGILDYQGAMWGPLPYDLANLLEDIRRDVPQTIRRLMLDRYCQGVNDKAAFLEWYDVLAMQFYCRIIGQIIKLALDGKPALISHLPRVEAYIRTNLEKPVFKPLLKWFEREGVDFTLHEIRSLDSVRDLIARDAF